MTDNEKLAMWQKENLGEELYTELQNKAKPMTDNEIVKAFECCYLDKPCEECPFCKLENAELNCFNGDEKAIPRMILDLFDRQKAEIERLNKEVETFADIGKMYSEIKAEAVKEFAERLKKELFIKQNEHRDHWMETLNQHRGTEAYKDYEWSIDNWLRGYGEAVQDILAINQNFLKELVGEDDG